MKEITYFKCDNALCENITKDKTCRYCYESKVVREVRDAIERQFNEVSFDDLNGSGQ